MRKERFYKTMGRLADTFSNGPWLGWELGREGLPIKKAGPVVILSDSDMYYYDLFTPVSGKLTGSLFKVSEDGPHTILQEKSLASGRFAEESYLSRLREQGEKVIKVWYTGKFRYTVREK